MYKITILFLWILMSFFSCKSDKHKPLISALNDIEKSWSESEIKEFKRLSDTTHHPNFKKAEIYRDSVLLKDQDSILIKYFLNKNIDNPNSMASIIFVTLHRKFNEKPLKIDEQLDSYKNGRTPYSKRY